MTPVDKDVRAVVVLVTGPDYETTRAMAHYLVQERLAACVNVLEGVTSVYRWQDSVEETREALAIMKTTTERLSTLKTRVIELHPYDVPEFLVLPVSEGAKPYLDWVVDSVRPPL